MEHLERTFAVFLADSEWRTSLPPMPRAQRATAHALAEQWGFTSASTKAEPARYVEIFKNAKSARPSRCVRDPCGAGIRSEVTMGVPLCVRGAQQCNSRQSALRGPLG